MSLFFSNVQLDLIINLAISVAVVVGIISIAYFIRGVFALTDFILKKLESKLAPAAVLEKIFEKNWDMIYTKSRIPIFVEIFLTILTFISLGLFLAITVLVSKYEPKASDVCYSNRDCFDYERFSEEIFSTKWMFWTQFVISLGFIIVYVFEFIVNSSNRVRYVLRLYSVTLVISTVPAIVGLIQGNYFYGFEVLRVLQLLRTSSFFKARGYFFKSGLIMEIQYLLFQLLSIVVCAAGFIFVVENNTVNPDGLISTFLDSIYFITVTVTTVGYGDISPKSETGKVLVIAMIIVGFSTLPLSIGKALELFKSSQDRLHRKFHRPIQDHDQHVIAFFHHPSSIIPWLEEFYHPDRGEINTHACLMVHPSFGQIPNNVLDFCSKGKYVGIVTLLLGDPLLFTDLQRAKLKHAKAVFLMCNKFTHDQEFEDARIIMETYSLRSANPEVKLYVQILSPKHKSPLNAAEVHSLVCVQELTTGLIAASSVCPGFSTILINMCRSWTAPKFKFDLNPLEKDVLYSFGNEVYEVNLSHFVGFHFIEACAYIYQETGACLIGMIVAEDLNWSALARSAAVPHELEASSAVKLNPGGFKIITKDHPIGLVLCHHFHVINRILDLKPDLEKNEFNKNPDLTLLDASPSGNVKLTERRFIPQNIEDCLVNHIDEIKGLNDFVLLIGDFRNYPNSLIALCKRLRSYQLKIRPAIVILTPEIPKPHSWRRIAHLPDLYLIEGVTTELKDLRRAGVDMATNVLVAAHGSRRDESSFDAKAVMIYRLIKNEISGSVMLSLVYDQNIIYLGVDKEEKNQLFFSTLQDPFLNANFVQGKTFSSSFLDALLVGTYYSNFLTHTVEQLCRGYVYSIKVSDFLADFENRPYSELFQHLLQSELICLGIMQFHHISTHRYCITHPPKDFIVRGLDKVILLRCPYTTPNSFILDSTPVSRIKPQAVFSSSSQDFSSKALSDSTLVERKFTTNPSKKPKKPFKKVQIDLRSKSDIPHTEFDTSISEQDDSQSSKLSDSNKKHGSIELVEKPLVKSRKPKVVNFGESVELDVLSPSGHIAPSEPLKSALKQKKKDPLNHLETKFFESDSDDSPSFPSLRHHNENENETREKNYHEEPKED